MRTARLADGLFLLVQVSGVKGAAVSDSATAGYVHRDFEKPVVKVRKTRGSSSRRFSRFG